MHSCAIILTIVVLICCIECAWLFADDTGNLDNSRLNSRIKRKAVEKDSSLWPNGEIPYILTDEISSNSIVMRAINGAINTIEKDSCVKFKLLNQGDITDPRPKEKYVRFVKAVGCHSSVGKTDSEDYQDVSIGRSCGYPEMVLHELGHLVGMSHEHCRPDRDAHIMVNWSNIYDDMAYNFDKTTSVRLLTPYDLSSVMHYGLKVFSKNKKFQSIVPLKDELSFLVGYRHDLSFYDKYTLNTLYKCSAHCSRSSPACENEGFLDTNCHCICPRLFTGDRCQTVLTDFECGGIISVDGVTFVTSPNYPNNYGNSMSCVWHLKSASNKLMSLTFEDFDLETGRMGICRDQLELRSHYIGLDRGHVYCGTEMNQTFISTTNNLILNFRSNSMDTRRGFKARVELLDRKDCFSSPCQNGGLCKQMEYYNDYYCDCKDNWIGRHCDIPVVNGGISEWGEWSPCTATCGLQCRHRDCTNPVPQNGGRECNDVMAESRRCQSEYTNCTGQFICDFKDRDMCGMRVDGVSRLKWAPHVGATPSLNTGPSQGHFAMQGDGYVYMESSYGLSKEETTLWLPSSEWRVGIYCLQFFYHMHGMTAGSLRVLRKTAASQQPQILWQSSNDHGNVWMEANVNILLYEGIKVGFVGIKGRGYYSDIAIDAISLSPRACAFPRNTYAQGCKDGTEFYHVGFFSYFENCERKNCFCNPDGRIDCPDWDVEDICGGYDPYGKRHKTKKTKISLKSSLRKSRRNQKKKLRKLSKKQNKANKDGKKKLGKVRKTVGKSERL